MNLFYTGQVRLNWNFVWLAMLAMLLVGCAGCSGVNAGTSVSPATFLLPGIMKAEPQCGTNAPVAWMPDSKQIAFAQ